MNKLIILSVDDWQVLYVNGDEKYQSHMIDISHISKFCPISSIGETWISGKLSDYVEEYGRFPSTLEECVRLGYEPQ